MSWRTPLNLRCVVKQMADLVAPCVDLRWKIEGSRVLLQYEGETVFSSEDVNFYGGGRYDYMTHHELADVLLDYICTPVKMLRAGEAKSSQSRYHNENDELKRLTTILLAADRRLGKNFQERWLFMAKDRTARAISGSRL